MGFFKKSFLVFVGFFIIFTNVYSVDKEQIIYLTQVQELEDSLALYENYKKIIGKHDFELLVRMVSAILENGARSNDPEVQALSFYGAGFSYTTLSFDALEMGIKSLNFETQLATIKLVEQFQDDRGDNILVQAMASPFLTIRMGAGACLASRKHIRAVGQIEALMHKIPEKFWVHFPELFALIGTKDSLRLLKDLMSASSSTTRAETILSVARFNLEAFLPKIRAVASHGLLDEQEACAFALGYFKDSTSIERLKSLVLSSDSSVRLAALHSLYKLGDANALEGIFSLCKKKNIFAIYLLKDLPGGEDLLASFLDDDDLQVRFNAAFALLKKRDLRAFPCIEEFLFRTVKDFGFYPHISLGRSLFSWKVVPSAKQHKKIGEFDLTTISFQLRKEILQACLEFPEETFIRIAHLIFDSGERVLVPFAVSCLENNATPCKIDFLKKNGELCEDPLIRMYCNLALYRLKVPGPYEELIQRWLAKTKFTEIVQLHIYKPWDESKGSLLFDLCPEQSSLLLLEAYKTLAASHDEKAIDLLLEGIKEGNVKNRVILAGLLLCCLQ
jgi:HEAT repeat protein